MKITMVNRFILTIFIALGFSTLAFATTPITFDWNGKGTSWASASSWTASDGSTTNYPGSSSRTTDIVRFAVKGSSYTNQPTLSSSVTVASIEFGGGIEKSGTQLTVNTGTLTVTGTITQNINTSGSTNFDYLQGSGAIVCTGINLGSGTNTNGDLNFLLSDVTTLTVNGNIILTANVFATNGSGFRLENGDMFLTGTISFANTSNIAASITASDSVTNVVYFTINTKTQANSSATTPHLHLSNQNAITSIPSPLASINFYGDVGGVGTVSYTASSPTVYTTATPGFGTGGGTIDTAKTNYDNLIIEGSGTAQIGGGGTVVGTLHIAGNFTTSSPATFNPAGASATNTNIGGSWSNTSTITGGPGTTAVDGNLTNSGTITFSTGNVDVGGNISNTATLRAGSGSIQVDGNLSTSSALTLSGGNLIIKGNYTNTATFTAGSGAVNFIGPSAESLIDNSSTGTTFNNVNFSGGGTKTMSGTGSFAVSSSGILTMAASNILQTGAILTLNSAATGSATVAAIPSTSSITGNVNVERYISGGSNLYRGYRFLSSPVYTAKSGSNYYYDFSYLTKYAPTTGTTGTAGGFTQAGNPTIYLYRNDVTFTNKSFNTGNFRGVNKINNSPLYTIGVDIDGPAFNLTVGTGFFFFYRGNLSNLGSKFTSTTSAESNVFMSTGTLNQQAVTIVNWFTGLSTLQFSTINGADFSGFNLIGNPYASSIDWNTYSTTNSSAGIYAPGVGSTIYIYNETSKVYATYSAGIGTNGGSNIIPSGQGFFVKATGTGASLVFNEAAKTNSQLAGPTQSSGNSTLLLSATPVTGSSVQYLRLQLAADSINTDETVIRFDNNASNGYVFNEDAQYMPGGGVVSLSSMSSDNIPVVINDIPLPKPTQTIKLNVGATATGQYTFNRTGLQNIPALFDVWLMDAYKKDSLDLKHNATYKFDVSLSDTNSYGADRFTLVIRQNPALGVHLLSFNATKTTGGALTVWKTENEASYTNFTIERSTNGGVTFEALGGFASDSLGTYNFLDKNPPQAVDQYRLKITDLNGAISYSQIVTLIYGNASLANNVMNVYPNPAKSTINLAILNGANSNTEVSQSIGSGTNAANTVYNIEIVSNTGSVIKTATTTQAAWTTDVSNLVPGIYIIQVINNNSKSLVGKKTFIKL